MSKRKKFGNTTVYQDDGADRPQYYQRPFESSPVELSSPHDSLTVKCQDGSTRTTNLNEHITFGKRLSERMAGRAVFDIEAGITGEKLETVELQFNNWPKFLNGGLSQGQLSAIMPVAGAEGLFPKTNIHLNLALEAMRRGHKLVFTCQEDNHDYEAQLASMGYPK